MKISFAATVAILARSTFAECTEQQRVDVLKSITTAFNTPEFPKSEQLINALPLQNDCTIFLYINGSPGVQQAFNAETSKEFAAIARQVFAHVTADITDYGNGTSLYDAIVTLGVRTIQSPVKVHASVPIEFNLKTCQITRLPAHLTVPASVAGIPIPPLALPPLGIKQLPAVRDLLKLLGLSILE